jgi:8-oxo-dGTP pyrophosphatase MutT (NUDIX family)
MSVDEKKRILEHSFEKLWENMWGNVINSQYKNEEIVSSKKMESMRNGIKINNEIITLQNIVEKSTTSWVEPEWEFPKGRRNAKEKDIDCALREFEEETGILKNKIVIIENIIPFEETFIGTNYKSYKHKYYLAYIDAKDYNLEKYQVTEVSKIEWKTIDECISSIRPYNLEKKKLITDINKVLKEYRLYL